MRDMSKKGFEITQQVIDTIYKASSFMKTMGNSFMKTMGNFSDYEMKILRKVILP
jgi:hypothetical protein